MHDPGEAKRYARREDKGIISPITFIISLFNNHVNVYEVHNNGNWYNFGFVLGAGILLGGGGTAGSRRRGH